MVQSCGGVQLILVGQELCDVVLRKLGVPCILQLQKFCCVVQMNGTGSMYTLMPCVLQCGSKNWNWFNVYFSVQTFAVWFKGMVRVQRILVGPEFCTGVQRNLWIQCML